MEQKKWNLGDIRPPERPERSKRRAPAMDIAPNQEQGSPTEEEVVESTPTRRKKRTRKVGYGGGKRRLVFIIGGIIILLALIFLSSFIWRDAELVVHPRFEDVTVQATFTASQSPIGDALGYELLSLEETGERTVDATGAEEVEELATGTVTLYNAYSTKPERLIKNTRLETPDGKIFKITESAIVPGYTTNSAGDVVPGSIVAQVFASEAGESYNVEATRFTIPGLEAGSEQFKNMYAESSTSMHGGFIGTKLIVAEDVLAKTTEEMHAELRSRLTDRLMNERPAGFELYDNGATVRFESLPSIDAGDNRATVREKAILEVPIFKNTDLARYIAQNTIPNYTGDPVRIENAQSLSFAYATNEDSETPAVQGNNIEFNLNGEARIVWDYDENKLREDIAGVSKKDLASVLAQYPAIPRAETIIKPFWKRSFPDSPLRIKITEILESN